MEQMKKETLINSFRFDGGLSAGRGRRAPSSQNAPPSLQRKPHPFSPTVPAPPPLSRSQCLGSDVTSLWLLSSAVSAGVSAPSGLSPPSWGSGPD